MFTGIVEALGRVSKIVTGSDSAQLTIESPGYFSDIKLGDSISVNGCCLTVVTNTSDLFTVDVMKQTLAITNTGNLKEGDTVNLEKAMLVTDRLGGHIVQGHVDALATVLAINDGKDWYELIFEIPRSYLKYIQPQGSITLNGVSLTVAKLDDESAELSVWLIPETLKRTNLSQLKPGDQVNLEVDVLAKYVERILKVGDK
ncbi:MAG: riboflavin synthase [Candidatus Nanopelagicaceae bacterium]